jgi:hypothetical protein
MTTRPPVFGVLAEFDDSDALLGAARRVRDAGYTRLDAYSPYPLSDVAEALGMRRTAVPALMLTGGLVGCVAGFLMQYWINVVDYPINVGGRPPDSWPSFIPVTFELTVLTSALVGLFGFLALCGLPRLYHPVFNVSGFLRASRDRFFLCVESADPRFDRAGTAEFLASLGPRGVTEVPW